MNGGRREPSYRLRRQSLEGTRTRTAALRSQVQALEEANRVLKQDAELHRRSEQRARSQAQMLIESVGFLATEPDIDRFLGHVLRVTVEQIDGVGGTLWFPDPDTGNVRLHLEYLDSRIIPAHESHHPAVLCPLPIGGRGVSTFPTMRAETYVMQQQVAGMPEVNRAYINSLGVRILLTVPMMFGNETVGWICVRSTRADPREVEKTTPLAEALASQATLAVHMARLGERARQAAILQERNRIARDIHDTLAQGFTGVLVNLEAASRALRKERSDLATSHLHHARSLAQSCLDEARQSVSSLRPESFTRLDFSRALEQQVERLEASGASGRALITGDRLVTPAEVEAELLRIAQECITNVLKHARASSVEIVLDYGPRSISLSVNDDGAGFDSSTRRDGFGLVGMRERAARIGGVLTIECPPSGGTHVITRVPIGASVHS
ncbi:MAG: sensor histidine kinase [Betaproteobacteria bacterium]|nr:sensor histidine kinase [Betaproteobacteria bacterium]